MMVPTAAHLGRIRTALAASFFACGCATERAPQPEEHSELVAHALSATSPSSGSTRFAMLPSDTTGIDFVNRLLPQNNFSYLNIGAGVATGDYDGDGRVDVYLASIDGPNRLYRQVAPWRFEDVTARAGVDGGAAWSRGATFVDVDDDGDLDLYVCNTEAPNLLYVNQGNGTFVEAARERGLDHVGASVMASFVDYDRDGDLDCYLVTHRALHFMLPEPLVAAIEAPAATRRTPRDMRPPPPKRGADGSLIAADPEHWFRVGPRYEIAGEPDVLLRNEGHGRFVDVTEAAGLLDHGLGLSATWLDIDADGWLDLHVANDLMTADRLYRNQGDGTFVEVTEAFLPHTPWFSMGADCADVDNDGRDDLLVADMSATTHYRSKILMGDMSAYRWFLTHTWPRQLMRNALYVNSGAGRFLEVAYLAGLASTDWTWAVQLSDLDNDGWVDAFFTNGAPRDDTNPDHMQTAARRRAEGGEDAFAQALAAIPAAPDANLAFRNTGAWAFENVSRDWGLAHAGVSFGVSLADLDGDGDLDGVVNNLNEPATVYRNEGPTRHRLLIRLRGTTSNAYGIGARISVETASTQQQRRMLLTRGYMSSNDPVVHFGLGNDEVVRSLQVDWPSGRTQRFENLAANHLYEVTEPEADPSGDARVRPTPVVTTAALRAQFEEVSHAVGLDHVHQERLFDDYAAQALLPGKLSQQGPGIAVGDVDADGDADVFIAGAAGQAGALFLDEGTRGFVRVPGAWMHELPREDLAPLFFDADGDDDLDLFVTSGSIEHPTGDARLRDRLYLNDGTGTFTLAPGRLGWDAAESSGCVAAADFDRDGDLDLFVGGRALPGRYPESPRSFLLRNEPTGFVDVTDTWAPGLRDAGMVTSALWSDADGDTRVDLLVCVEWGPVRLFRNTGTRLAERTQEAGLADRTGWWNALAGGDLDHDGDVDYVVLNCGLNTKYGKPTPEKPAVLFYGDMDRSGRPQLIEAKSAPEGLLPVRGRSCSSASMPFIRDAFPTYHSFASAVLSEIYDPLRLQAALSLRATTLASGVLWNDGAGRFTWRALPTWVQVSPGYGVAVGDFDADGASDIYLVQNSFTREPETGVWAGGLSVWLAGDGRGGFSPVGADRSGLVVPGDAKGLAVLDLDHDGWPDFVVTQNDGRTLAFRNRRVAGRRSVAVHLRGPRGNPTAVGARVVAQPDTPEQQLREQHAGSGYLSQSSDALFFGFPAAREGGTFAVVWPDGRRSTHEVRWGAEHGVHLEHPDRVASRSGP